MAEKKNLIIEKENLEIKKYLIFHQNKTMILEDQKIPHVEETIREKVLSLKKERRDLKIEVDLKLLNLKNLEKTEIN